MKRVLLDANANWRILRDLDADFHGVTARRKQWDGIRNGELLNLAQQEFDVLLTHDQSIAHQQNLRRYEIGIVIIETVSNHIDHVRPLMSKVNEAIRQIQPHQVVRIQA